MLLQFTLSISCQVLVCVILDLLDVFVLPIIDRIADGHCSACSQEAANILNKHPSSLGGDQQMVEVTAADVKETTANV